MALLLSAAIASGCGPIVAAGAVAGAAASGGGGGGGSAAPASPLAFSERVFAAATPHDAYVTAGDLDGDGRIDVVSTTPSFAGQVALYRNITVSGSGSVELAPPIILAFAALVPGSRPPVIDDSTCAVAVMDLDGDGRPEVVVASGRLVVFRNLTAGPGSALSFSSAIEVSAASFHVNVRAIDMNQDGLADLVAADEENQVSVFLNATAAPGPPGFAARALLPVAGAVVLPSGNIFVGLEWPLAVADLDGDDRPDVVAAAPINDGTPARPEFRGSRVVVLFNATQPSPPP